MSAVLEEDVFNQMPPISHVDPYESCLQEAGDYCSVNLELISDTPNELFTKIQEYSAHRTTHFNYTKLFRGICMTKTCEHILHRNQSVDPKHVLEACLNDSLWKDYRLKAKLDTVSCKNANIFQVDIADTILAVVLIVILSLNVIGTLQQLMTVKSNIFLSCFSLAINFRRLMSPVTGKNPISQGMRSLDALKVVTSVLVICCHGMLPFTLITENPRFWEQTFVFFKYVCNGTMFVQTFFILSGYLLGYFSAEHIKKESNTLTTVAFQVLLRWLRLMAPTAIVLWFLSSWLRFTNWGPFWQVAIGNEIEGCRRDWWKVILGIANYDDNTRCKVEYWYLYCDLQLHIFCLLICTLSRGKIRSGILGFLVIIGIILPVLHTYFQDLDGVLLLTPEAARSMFYKDPTFNHVYKRSHNNIFGYVIGIICGLTAHHWKTTNYDVLGKYKKFRYVAIALLPLNLALLMLGSTLYADRPSTPLYIRMLWSLTARNIFSASVGLLTLILTFKCEDLLYKALSGRSWQILARLSFGTYILHMIIIRAFIAKRTFLLRASVLNYVLVLSGFVVTSYIAAFPLYLLVEAPVEQLIKMFVTKIFSSTENIKKRSE